MPTMPTWLSAIVQWFNPDHDHPVPVGGLAPVVPERKKRAQGGLANLYGFPRKSAAKLAWEQEPAPRVLSPGPTIDELLAKDAKIDDPYEQKTLHVDYIALRPSSKSEWDFCAICYFEDSRKIREKKENLDKHFETEHRKGGTGERCGVCMAMFFSQHLKWHTQYCHPHIAVGI